MTVKNWVTNEKAKYKAMKKAFFKWMGIAIAVVVGLLVMFGVYTMVKRNNQNAEAASLEAQAAGLSGGIVAKLPRRAYTAPISLSAGGVGWRLRSGQRVVPVMRH